MDYENQLLDIARGRAAAYALAIAWGGGGIYYSRRLPGAGGGIYYFRRLLGKCFAGGRQSTMARQQSRTAYLLLWLRCLGKCSPLLQLYSSNIASY